MTRFMQRVLLAAIVILLPAISISWAQDAAKPLPPSSYHRIDNGLKLPPGKPLGSISSLDFDAQGNQFVLQRCVTCGQHPKDGDPPSVIWKFDKDGNFLGEWGEGAIAKEGHSIRIDRFGFIWVTDTMGHQVKKYRPSDGKVVLTLGKYGVPGATEDTFNQPTDVFVLANGDTFITDGYGNQRVVKFDKNGKFIKTWGTKGTGPGQFRLPHSIIQDNRGRLLVGDRCGISTTHCKGARIEILDVEGNYLDQWPTMGGDDRFPMSSPATLYYIPKTDTLYATASDMIYVADGKTGKVRDYVSTPGLVNHGLAVNHEGDIFSAGIDRGWLVRYTLNASK